MSCENVFKGVPAIMLGRTAAGLRPRTGSDPVMHATKTSIRTLGRRVVALEDEIKLIGQLLTPLVADTVPDLLALHGVGTDTAAVLLVAAGDNTDRLRSSLGSSLRGGPHRGILGQGHPPPTQQRR